MQHLEVSGAVVLYIGRTVSKGLKHLIIRCYMFRSIWTILREPMPILAKVTLL
jgi:hypothetical protein